MPDDPWATALDAVDLAQRGEFHEPAQHLGPAVVADIDTWLTTVAHPENDGRAVRG